MPITVDQISDYLRERTNFLARLLYNEDGTPSTLPQGKRERILSGFDELMLIQGKILEYALGDDPPPHVTHYVDGEWKHTITSLPKLTGNESEKM